MTTLLSPKVLYEVTMSAKEETTFDSPKDHLLSFFNSNEYNNSMIHADQHLLSSEADDSLVNE